MAANSGIEWTGDTWNCLSGCEAISPGCAHCYAATMTRRLEAIGQADYTGLTTAKHFNGVVRCLPHKLDIPLKRKKPTTYFVNSMSDLFHEDVPDDFIDRVFAVMSLCPQHTFQVLTKRAERMQRYLYNWPNGMSRGHHVALQRNEAGDGLASIPHRHHPNGSFSDGTGPTVKLPLPNVWLGVSAEDQQRADERIPWLLKTPAAVRFVSAEPLLGPITLDSGPRGGPPRYMSIEVDHNDDRMLDWVIVGGESGGGSRPCDLTWIRSIVKQCQAAGVPCFVKQVGAKPILDCPPGEEAEGQTREDGSARYWTVGFIKDKKGGEPSEWPADLRVREMPHAIA